MPNTTWNPLDAHTKWVSFSGGNLVASAASVAADGGLVGKDGKSTGKYYFEVNVSSSGFGVNSCVGVETLSPAWNIIAPNSTSGCVTYSGGSIWYNGGSQTGTLGLWVTGDTICVALDLTNSKVWFRRNGGNWDGNATHNPATNTGGISISTLVASGRPWFIFTNVGSGEVSTYTLNSGDTTFAQSVPSGFTSGWPDNGATISNSVFDPSTATSAITLSNSYLTVTAVSSATPQRIKLWGSATTGKYYWEFYINQIANNTGQGIANANTLTDNFYNNGTDGAVLYTANGAGSVWINGTNSVVSTANLSGGLGGAVACVAVDFGAKLIWFRTNNSLWNNSGTANPATNVGGLSFSAFSGSFFGAVCGVANQPWQLSLNNTNFFKIPPPAGFTLGAPPPAGPIPDTTRLNVFGLGRETVLETGPGYARALGLARETVVAPTAEARFSQLVRETLILGEGQLRIGQLVRESLVSGTGLSATIGVPRSGISGSLTAGAPPVLYSGNINASSGLSAALELSVPLAARISSSSSASMAIPLPLSFSKINSYSIMVSFATNLAKFVGYNVLVASTEALTKIQGYVVLSTLNKMDLTKANSYAVLNFPLSLGLAKTNAYGVLKVKPLQMNLFKVNSYAVLRGHLTPGDEWPWYAISSS